MLRKYDLVILSGWIDKYCKAAIAFHFLFKAKLCAFSDHPVADGLKWWKNLLLHLLLFRNIDFFLCATQSTIKFFHKYHHISLNKLKLFPYAHKSINNESEQGNNTERINALTKGDKINLFIANRFIARKGYDVVFKAFEKLKDNGLLDRFRIVIAGNGELLSTYEQKFHDLSPNICFKGWIENNTYEDLLHNCDIYLHASLFEPFGIPPLDALSEGKLLISSDGVQSVNGVFKNGEEAFIYPANDADALAGILMSLNKAKIYEIGEKGRQALLKNYNKELLIESVNACL